MTKRPSSIPVQAIAPPCSSEVEAWLKGAGVAFGRCRNIPIDQIDTRSSRRNQARENSVSDETVSRYAQAMKNGSTFPPIVVYKRGDQYVIVDGNHRHAAAQKAGLEQINVYVIDSTTPMEVIQLLTAEANTKHGDPTPVAWRVHQAIQLIALGHDAEQIAVRLGLSRSQITSAFRCEKLDIRADRLGIGGWESLAPSVKIVLGSVVLDSVFKNAAMVAIQTGWGNAASLREFVKGIKAQSSEAEALEYIGQVHADRINAEKARKAAGRKNPLRNYKTQVVTALGAVMALDPIQVPRYFLTDAERKELSARPVAAAERLLNIDSALGDTTQVSSNGAA